MADSIRYGPFIFVRPLFLEMIGQSNLLPLGVYSVGRSPATPNPISAQRLVGFALGACGGGVGGTCHARPRHHGYDNCLGSQSGHRRTRL